MAIPLLIAGGVAAAGAVASGIGTANAQNAANKAAAQNAATQSAQSFSNYLATQGTNLQQLAAKHPDLLAEYNRVVAQAGEKRDFQTWLVTAIKNAPDHPIWDDIANPSKSGAAANVNHAAWAVDASGKPIEQSLYNQLLAIANQKGDAAAAAEKAAIAGQWAAQRPDLKANWDADPGYAQLYGSFENYVLEDYGGNATPEQKQTVGAAAAATAPAATAATQPGVAGVGNNTTIDPAIIAQLPNAPATLNRIFDGSLLNEQLAAQVPVNAARDAVAAGQAARTIEQRNLSGSLLGTDLAGIAGVLDARKTGAGGVYEAAVTGAGGVYDATLGSAEGIQREAAARARAIDDMTRAGAVGAYDAATGRARGIYGATETGAGGIYDAATGRARAINEATGVGAQGIYDATAAGAGGVYDATLTGAGGVRDAASATARAVSDANITKLADLLGVRREAAAAIYAASTQSAGGVRDARTTGARGIYDAELLQADTYRQAANQALTRSLAEQTAERARRGFTGGSSGSDMTRARLNADYLQRGAGARTGAGVNYAGRISDTGVNYASEMGRAGVGQATTLGQASEADAAAKLAVAVQLAQQLGLANTNYATQAGNAGITRAGTMAGAGTTRATTLAGSGVTLADMLGLADTNRATTLGTAGVTLADQLGLAGTNRAATIGASGITLADQLGAAGVNRATTVGGAGVTQAGTVAGAGTTRAGTLASAGEQNAIATLQAQVADATRRLSYLTADADIAKANADLQKAQDALKAITDNQARQVGAISAPFNLAGLDLALKDRLTDQQFAELDALYKRIGISSTAPASGPAVTTSNPGAVISPLQIGGAALTAGANTFMSGSSLWGGPGAAAAPAATVPAATTPGLGLGQTPSFLSGASVFKVPGT
jgi:hypothetical protein